VNYLKKILGELGMVLDQVESWKKENWNIKVCFFSPLISTNKINNNKITFIK